VILLEEIQLSPETIRFCKFQNLLSNRLRFSFMGSKEDALGDMIINEYCVPEWDKVIEYYNHFRYRKDMKITECAYKLAKRVKKDTEIDVFPIIERVYAGHWQRSEGAWVSSMRDQMCLDIGFNDKVQDCLNKKNKLVFNIGFGFSEIYAETIYE
jgi:hypothetical protein